MRHPEEKGCRLRALRSARHGPKETVFALKLTFCRGGWQKWTKLSISGSESYPYPNAQLLNTDPAPATGKKLNLYFSLYVLHSYMVTVELTVVAFSTPDSDRITLKNCTPGSILIKTFSKILSDPTPEILILTIGKNRNIFKNHLMNAT